MRRKTSFIVHPCLRRTFVAALAIGACLGHTRLRADVAELGLAGNDQVLWVYHRRTEADGTPLLRLAYHRSGTPAQMDQRPTQNDAVTDAITFWPLRVPPIEGGITHAVARGSGLHVFYRDGTHKRYVPGAEAWDAWSSPTFYNERVLPRSAPPLLVACDERTSMLYALITAAHARELAAVAAEQTARDDVPFLLEADPPNVAETLPEQPSFVVPEDVDFVLVRYGPSGWVLDRLAPEGMLKGATPLNLWVRDGVVHMTFRTHGSDSTLLHSTTKAPDDFWTDALPLPVETVPVAAAAGWFDEHPVLLMVERRAYGLAAYSLRYASEVWKPGPVLTDQAGAPLARTHPLAVALFDGRAALAWLGADRVVEVGLWEIETGRPQGSSAVSALKPEQALRPSPRATLLLEYAILSAILAAVFLWRRETVVVMPPLREDQELAPAVRRLAAIVIDVCLLFPIWALVFYLLILSEDRPINETMTLAMNGETTQLRWFPSLMGAVVGLYGFVMESMTGATVGKRITGLTVLTLSGERCGVSCALLRNVVRVVEFQFAPLVLLVALTPARQRLGDIVARSVVVAFREVRPIPPDMRSED